MMGRRCKVCGKKLILHYSLRYEVTRTPVGFNCLTERAVTYEAFDCPKCGCQNIVGIREVKNEPVSTSD